MELTRVRVFPAASKVWRLRLRSIQTLVFLAIMLVPMDESFAKPGEPVAVRRSGGCFVIESMWNLSVQIITAEQFRSTALQGVDLVRHETNNPSIVSRIRHDTPPGTQMDHTLDRRANAPAASWTSTPQSQDVTANAIRVRASGPVIVIDVDGVRIAYLDHDASELDDVARQISEDCDVLIVGPGDSSAGSGSEPASSRLIESKILVLGTDDRARSAGSTLAVRAGHSHESGSRRTERLDDRPLTLSAELEKLMMAKEAACSASQEVFSKLSVTQMNFRPSNGSHTPRWNAEHMMGRELLFFSQIFNAQDQAIPVMDLNPKQMPPDYVARHAEWTGMEEAQQMQRVSSFTSRFAHLLKDLPLDEKAPGSSWTLRGLLRQMDRHYSEHTANVQKKFELEDWPKE